MTDLLAVPNFSEGRDRATLDAIAAACECDGNARVLDLHADRDHHRAVLTLAGAPGQLAGAVLAAAREALARIDVSAHEGVHPRMGAIDVAPIVYVDPADRGAACAEALVLADDLGRELRLPVLLYGALAGGRTRVELRRGGPNELTERLRTGALKPDFGPRERHPTGGATLVAARPPLVAFNLELEPPAGMKDARAIAEAIREGGAEGLPGVRALGLELASRGSAQVSLNVEDPAGTPLAAVVAAVRRHAPVAAAELVGLAPAAAFEGFSDDVPMPGFDPARHLIENALAH